MRDHDLLISAETLHDSLGESDLCVIDCRFDLKQPEAGRQDYLQGHLPGSVYADLDEDLAAQVRPDSGRHPLPDLPKLIQTLSEFGIGPDAQVVVYDELSGAIAARAWWLLRWLGHRRVAVLDGGLSRWRALGMPLQSGPVRRAYRKFTGRPRPEMIIGTADIMADFRAGAPLRLVDARDKERFRGEHEPIDPVAGHVPGARNLPCADNLTAEGLWKSGPELRQIWTNVLAEDFDDPFSVMCGSGVTACQLVLSSLSAGLGEPRVYIGSWSEWIRDPERPVTTGPA